MEEALYAKNLADAKLASLDKSNDMHSLECHTWRGGPYSWTLFYSR
jgi:hypothetical protein